MSEKMQPIVILPKGEMTKVDIARLRKNGICVVEAKEPSKVRFAEPYPQGYDIQDAAAIELAYMLLRDAKFGGYNYRKEVGSMYADILIRGVKLPRIPEAEKVTK